MHFKPVLHLPFQKAGEPRPNVLRVQLGPDRLALDVNINSPYEPFDLKQIKFSAGFAPQEFFSAYERIFLDLREGNTIPSSCGATRSRSPGGSSSRS